MTITGSLLYIAPELYITDLPYSKAINIQSFGLIALELLTNWEPNLETQGSHGLLSPRQHNDWVCNVIPIHVASAPETFRSILKGLLCKEPKQRQSIKECQKQLLGIVLAGTSTQGGTSDSKKWLALVSEDDSRRNVRSQHPTQLTISPERCNPQGLLFNNSCVFDVTSNRVLKLEGLAYINRILPLLLILYLRHSNYSSYSNFKLMKSSKQFNAGEEVIKLYDVLSQRIEPLLSSFVRLYKEIKDNGL